MTTLLIDLGNTALKWTTLEEPDSPHTIVHRGSTHFKEELYELWLQMHPTRIIGCTVAAPVVAFSLTKFFNDHGINWVWVRSEPSFDGDVKVRNCYARPSQLGADRWYAAIGAADALRSEALLVVHTGTATTVDSIVRDGDGIYRFMGGRIAPGPSLMQDCLSSGIPSLPRELSDYRVFPQCTSEAITTGIIDAQVGLILRARHQMTQNGVVPKVILAGGAAQFIAPHLREEVPDLTVRHNLVMRGLAGQARMAG